MLVLGSIGEMFVMLTTGPSDSVLKITAGVGKVDGISGQRILLLYPYWRQ